MARRTVLVRAAEDCAPKIGISCQIGISVHMLLPPPRAASFKISNKIRA
jgi:hypothetical protein